MSDNQAGMRDTGRKVARGAGPRNRLPRHPGLDMEVDQIEDGFMVLPSQDAIPFALAWGPVS